MERVRVGEWESGGCEVGDRLLMWVGVYDSWLDGFHKIGEYSSTSFLRKRTYFIAF